MKLLWLQSGGCGGCTMSLLCSSARDLPGLLAGAGIELAWHPSLSEATGDAVRTLLADFEAGRTALDLLCVEGSLLTGPAGSGRFHMLSGTGRAMIDWVRSLAARARYTVAVGTCAAYGGITAAGLNPAGAVGLQFDGEQRGGLLGADYRSVAGLPVINVAGCPTHPDWVTDTLIALALGRFAETDLDPLGRPRFYADQLVHHGCTRNEFYEFKASAETPGDLGCMMEHLGCKGTQAHADCNIRPWNGLGSCTNGGYPCISCTEPGFESPGHPFGRTPKVAGIPIGLPSDMPKAWFVALAALSKSATPERVRRNSVVEAPVLAPATRRTRLK